MPEAPYAGGVKRILVLGTLAIPVALFVALYLAGGAILRTAVEVGTAYCLDVQVSVGGGSLNPLTGRAGLSRMTIGNPPGFDGQHCFRVETMALSTRWSTLFSDTVVLDEILVDAPELFVEVNTSGTNLGALKARMDRKLGRDREPSAGAAGRRYLVKLMTIRGCKVHVAQPLGVAQLSPIVLPDLTVRDLGYDSRDGATMMQLVARLLDELAAAVGRNAAGLPRNVADALVREGSAAAKDLEQEARRSLETGDVEGLKKAVEKSAADAKKKIDDLLKTKK